MLSLLRCTEDLDECAVSEPCLNGGSCTQTEIPGNYTCACPEEYKVNFVNLDLLKKPVPSVYQFFLFDWQKINSKILSQGRNCEEVKVKTCDHHPCQNGATCRNATRPRDGDDLYFCDCEGGFKVPRK